MAYLKEEELLGTAYAVISAMFLFAIGVASMPFFQKYRSNIDLLLVRSTPNRKPCQRAFSRHFSQLMDTD